jgi:hypothetical protein
MGAARAGTLRLAAGELRGENSVPIKLAATEATAKTRTPPAGTAGIAPVIAAAEQASGAAPGPASAVEARDAIMEQAKAFFAREAAEQRKTLGQLTVALGLDRSTLGPRCGDLLKDDVAPPAHPADSGMMLRLCRSWSYAAGDTAAMFGFDRMLANLGDADAAARVPMHVLIGHDRAAPATK